jgi:hypothetical protein
MLWKIHITVLAAVTLAAGCASGGGTEAKPAPAAPSATSAEATASAPSSATATTSSEPTSDVLLPGTRSIIHYSDPYEGEGAGTFTVVVGKPLAIAEQPDNHSLWMGVPVTVADVSGSPVVASSNFGLSPVKDATYGEVASGGGLDEDAITRTACRRMKQLESALYDAGMQNNIVAGMDLTSDLKKTTGCVVFSYERTDRPNTVTYYPVGLEQADTIAASWSIKPPTSTHQPPSGIVYSVASDGGISSVTYATANYGQQQDTSILGPRWSVKIPNRGVQTAILTAQAGGGATTITCSITIDGEQVAKQQSRGSYAVVTCTAPD